MNGLDKQAALADKAFAEYDFGGGVEVTDSSGWEYATPGLERSRKVWVETAREDDGPAPSWQLTFTVRFDATGALVGAEATDGKGQVWGHLPAAARGNDRVSIRFASNMAIALNGVSEEWLGDRVEKAVYRAAFGEGVVTGSSAAEIEEHDFDVVVLSKAAADLDEGSVADWVAAQIEDGCMRLEEIPKVMARYALADPAQMRNELAERMGLA